MIVLDLAFAGLGIGAIAAMAGLGLLVTHRTTGVFNLAFGAVAVLAAYLLWQSVRVWQLPVLPSAAVIVVGVCPALGVVIEWVVFRPLQRRRASGAELLVASLGVFVVIVGAVVFVWGAQTHTDAPSLTPSRPFNIVAGATIRADTLVDVVAVLMIAIGLAVALRSRLGLAARAVVEDRTLAALASVDVDRLSVLAWALGTALAGFAGILIAPSSRLDPYSLTLVVLETMAAVVVGRLVSPVATVLAALAIGIAQSELTQVHLGGRLRGVFAALTTNLFVVVLLAALLLLRRLVEPGGADAGRAASLATRGSLPTLRYWWVPCALALGAPLLLSRTDLETAQQMPALAIVFVSIVVVGGYSGQISLGQAGLAGLGALLTAKLSHGVLGLPALPGLLALAVAVLAVGVFGLLAAWPAIRRRGLFLALTTFAVAVVVSRFVFAQPVFVSNVTIEPPSWVSGGRAFYLFELACLGVAVLVVRNHHAGRLGRSLQAVRDDEAGASACGIDAQRARIWVFAVSAALAGLGGALLAETDRAFDASAFDPVRGLVWFAAVVVFGVDSTVGAVLGAALVVGLDANVSPGFSTIVIGVGALALGRLPGGIVYSARLLVATLRARYVNAARQRRGPTVLQGRRLSPAGNAVAGRLGGQR